MFGNDDATSDQKLVEGVRRVPVTRTEVPGYLSEVPPGLRLNVTLEMERRDKPA